MTKLKNTKKGMAKKALSISLVAAMLATSNVPVWAAEDLFSAGETVEAEVAAPVEEAEIEAFSDVETPAVEEVETSDNNLAVTDNTQTSSRLKNVSVKENGWASYVSVSGQVLTADLATELKKFDYQWMVSNGNGGYREVASGSVTGGLNQLNTTKKYIPTAENLGKELFLHISKESDQNVGSRDNIDVMIPAGTVSKQNVNNMNRLPERFWLNEVDGTGEMVADQNEVVYPYLQKEIKPTVKDLIIKFDDANTVLGLGDFSISYTHAKGNFIDADSECEVVATPVNTDLYTGIVTKKYKIRERYYQKGDITAKVPETITYEYTGSAIVPEKSDVTLTESVRKTVLDSEKVIDEIWSDGSAGVGTHNVGMSLLDVPNYVQTSLPKKGGTGSAERLLASYEIVKRDLSKCTAEIDAVSLNGKSLATIVNEAGFAKRVHIYDANGVKLNLVLNQDYEVVLPTQTPTQNGTYNVSIKAKGSNTENHIDTTLTVTTHDFDECYFINSVNHNIENDPGNILTSKVPYTGETVSKDLSKLRFARWTGTKYETLEEGKDYKVTITGTNAGDDKGRIIVEGLSSGSYEGAKKVYYFDIEPAQVHRDTCSNKEDVTVASKVVFDRGNEFASDYAPKVTVKAHNTATPAPGKVFTLEEGKDYTVKYAFVTRNEIGAKIKTTITITNPNFKGANNVITRETTISRKQLSDCNIEVLGSYTYTGAAIIPDVKVTDGNEVLTKDVDYKVIASNNVNVTDKAVVTVVGVDQNEEGDGIYDPSSSKSTTFSITAADANNVKVVFADGNTGITYTGKNLKPTIVAVTLDGNDVTQQFDISYPTTNINVGTGSVVLTPVKGNKNFTGTKNAEFKIVARELTGTLTVYDKNGKKYDICTAYHEVEEDGNVKKVKDIGKVLAYPGEGKSGWHVEFDYDGKERTFADATFVPDGPYAKYVTEDDYEIKYVDNVYGGTAYIYVEGKGNFKGTDTITDAEAEIINSVVKNAAYKFTINTYQFKDQHVVIGNAEYAAGQSVKPEVTVTVLGQKLVEGKDYILHYDNRTELTNGKTQDVWVEGIKAFAGSNVNGKFAVVKRDMKNTDITVTEKADGTYNVVVKNTNVVVPASEYTVTTGEDSVTVTANADSKYYTGTQTVTIPKEEIVAPSAPYISNVVVAGNKATVILSGAADGATGYDYVISKDRNCIVNKDYNDVNKNYLNTQTTFNYVQEGTYYAYCHAWVRDENGKKQFSGWSNAYPFAVTSITPDTPKITSTKVSGSTVTITYTKAANATGYDLVLGSAVRKVSGEMRPVEYGTLVKKITKGNTVTATFKNVPSGTYYAGLHAYNRTSENGTKVFSRWSGTKTVTVK